MQPIAQQRAGLHLLQPRDVDRLAVAEAAFAGKIQHLAADHAADARRARQRAGQQQPHGRILVNLVAGDDVECERQQRVAGEDRGGIIRLLVQRRPAAAQIAVVHRRQVVMDQRVAVDAFQRRTGEQRRVAGNAEHGRTLDHQKRPQPFAAAEAANSASRPSAASAARFRRAIACRTAASPAGPRYPLRSGRDASKSLQCRSSLRIAPDRFGRTIVDGTPSVNSARGQRETP